MSFTPEQVGRMSLFEFMAAASGFQNKQDGENGQPKEYSDDELDGLIDGLNIDGL